MPATQTAPPDARTNHSGISIGRLSETPVAVDRAGAKPRRAVRTKALLSTIRGMNYTRAQNLPDILRKRIVVLDGAMGTMIQRYKLGEADYRGERFKNHPK